MGLRDLLFGSVRAPAHPRENADTLELLAEARRLAKDGAAVFLHPTDWLGEAAEAAACRYGYGGNAPLIHLLTELGQALTAQATAAALPDDLTVDYALRDVVAGVELRERLRDTLEYLRNLERHQAQIRGLIRDILDAAASTLCTPADDHPTRALFGVISENGK